jgi:quercetin dioxygenase-like cupin family protein
MIRRKDEHKITTTEAPFGGSGTVPFLHMATKEDLCDKGRLYAVITLKPGCSVGYHIHQGEFEVYHILKGKAKFNDNGEPHELFEGDTAWIKPGQGHSIANAGDKDLQFIGLVLYA